MVLFLLACLLGCLIPAVGFGAEPPPDLTTALTLYNDCQYSAARKIFSTLAAAHPDDPGLNFYLGRLALWFNDDSQALACLQKAAQLAPTEARIQNALGDAFGLAAQEAGLLSKFGWADKCLAAYRRAVELEPGNPDFHWSLLCYYSMAPMIAGGSMSKAYAQAAEIRKLDPVGGRTAFATLYLEDKRNAEAFAEFDGILGRQPDDYLALYQIGRCAALSGEQLGRGLTALRRCLMLPRPAGVGIPREWNIHYRIGNILEKQGDTAGARREYDLATKSNPDFRPAKEALKK